MVTIPASGECFDLDRPGAVAAWNRALNRRYGMENLRTHSNPAIRWIEARRRNRLAELVPPFDRALDLGAEDGDLARAWAPKGRLVVLLDLDPAMLSRAPAPRVAADGCQLPMAAGSFDLVVCSAILEHVVDPAALVEECRRVLRPGGRIVAYVPWDAAVLKVKRTLRTCGIGLGPLHADLAPGHLRTFDRAKLRRLFASVSEFPRVRLDPLSFGYYVEATV